MEANDFEKTVLPNGVRILTKRLRGAHSVSAGLWVFAGSRHERPEESGITHFIEHLLFKGTKTRDAGGLGEAFARLGGTFNAFTTQDAVCLHAHVIDYDLSQALDLLAEILLESSVPESEIDSERNVVLQEIKMCDDASDDRVIDLFHSNLWPSHALGKPILGSVRSLRRLRRRDILDYLGRVLRSPDRIVLALAGDFDLSRTRAQTRDLFSSLEEAPEVTPDNGVPRPEFRQRGIRRPAKQVHFCLGTLGPPRSHCDNYAFVLMSALLGGGEGSRLFEEIREKRGLVYSISSLRASFVDTGYLGVFGAAEPSKLEQVLDLIVTELRRLFARGLSGEELHRAREHVVGPVLSGMECTISRMMRMADCEHYWGRNVPMEETLDGLASVTPSDIARVAEQYLQGQPLCASAVGPLKRRLTSYLPGEL